MGQIRNRWQRFWFKTKHWLRPFFRETVPSQLCLKWSEYEGVCEGFLSDVGFRVRLGLRYGFLSFLDEKSERQIIQAWKPHEILLIKKLAIAVSCVKTRLVSGIIPDDIHVERLIELVYQWRRRWNNTLTRESVASAVEEAVHSRLSEHAIHEEESPRRIAIVHPLLDELYEIEETIDLHLPGIDSATSFNEISLLLAKPLDYGRYFCTPLNCAVFASTGGDGTHYSLLQINGEINEKSPVVMTLPSNCDAINNFIVGETLHDFLCLGVEWGYFSLEQIGYNQKQLEFYLADQPNCEPADLEELLEGMTPTKRKVLELLKARFDLKPWTDPEHWQRLQDTYQPLLHLPPNI